MLSIPQQGKVLDLRFFYAPSEALDYLRSLSGPALERYRVHEWLDLGFMAFYSLALASFWRAVAHSGCLKGLPWAAGVLDLVETGLILAFLHQPELLVPAPPGPALAMATVMAAATPLKYLCFYSTLGWILLSAAARALRERQS
jgi:hypothetical protein